MSITTTILRSHLELLMHWWPLNNDHLSTTVTIVGSQAWSLYTSLTVFDVLPLFQLMIYIRGLKHAAYKHLKNWQNYFLVICGPSNLFSIILRPADHFFFWMWHSHQIEFETPVLYNFAQKRTFIFQLQLNSDFVWSDSTLWLINVNKIMNWYCTLERVYICLRFVAFLTIISHVISKFWDCVCLLLK